MTKYDTYSPEIPYSDTSSEESRLTEESTQHNKSPHKARDKKNAPKKRTNTKKPKEKSESLASRIKAWANRRNLRLITGLFLGCVAVYLIIAFVSYLTHCFDDQSVINSVSIGKAASVGNKAGEGGARISEFLINECFGLGSLVIIFWLCAMSLKLLTERPHFKSVDFTIKCFVALIIISLLIGLSCIGLDTKINWGGYHGRYVNQFIIDFVGWSGASLTCLFLIGVFVIICLRDLIAWILRIKHKRDEIKRQIAEQKEAERKKREELEAMKLQEERDAARAGDSSLTEEHQQENTAGESVDFSSTELPSTAYDMQDVEPLYALPGASDSDVPDFMDIEQTEEYAEEDASYVNGYTNGTDKTNAGTATPENSVKESDDLAEDDPQHNPTDTMVVNVNQIASSGKSRFNGSNRPNYKYKYPPFSLLSEGKAKIEIDQEEQIENKRKIEKTLLDFGIPITSISATVGPTVTLYEIIPDKGVKLSSIRSLVDDIALSLAATGVRIIAPIPGKGTVGIEVANREAQTVAMRTVLQSNAFQNSRYELPVALGSTISNEVYTFDLAKMPHLLVAGATGQGKSVGLNAIITSLLYSKRPDELKFVMIDPKQVEFYPYAKIKNYYMAMMPGESDAVVTDTATSEAVLSSLVEEMERRYTLLKKAACRKITEYNEKLHNGELDLEEGHEFLPYIVVVIDEFGDLKMVSGKNVELPIARLGQKGRAAGIHVILATQRPSTDVITGLIKANFPARIAFAVSSVFDSKTILGTVGAEQLIGRGDLLISNNSSMIRVQCAFIDTPEVTEICNYVSAQPYPTGPYMLPEANVGGESAKNSQSSVGPNGPKDPMLPEIAREIVKNSSASTSSIQRSYSIGYNRAGRIMDQLEVMGVVGPSQGGKPRAVLVDAAKLEEILLEWQ